jgi:hypothetical protein
MNWLSRRNRNWLVWLLFVSLLTAGCGLMGGSPNEADLVESLPGTVPTAVSTPSPPAVTDTILAEPPPPQLYLVNLGQDEVVNREQPARLRLELAATAVSALTLHISQYTADDSLQPLFEQPLLNELPLDGIHQWPLVWYGDRPGDWPGDDEAAEAAEFHAAAEPFLNAAFLPRQPLPDGRYQLAIQAENETGMATVSLDLLVVVPAEPPADRLYLDPQHAFQFRYPADWQTPVYSDTLLLSSHLTATQQMQIIRYPDLPPVSSASDLIERTLAEFGPVSRLYQDQPPLAEAQARRVAYGYTRADGAARTGVLIALRDQNHGYVVDVEGDAAAETAVWQTAEQIATSWQFGSASDDPPPIWTWHTAAGLTLAQPQAYSYQELRGWHRYSRDRDTFWAMRVDGVATADVVELDRRLQDAGMGVDDFGAGRPYYFVLDGQRWLRADFSYTNSRQEQIQGAILLSIVGGQPLVVWLEAPLNEFTAVEEEHFLRMLIEVVRGA